MKTMIRVVLVVLAVLVSGAAASPAHAQEPYGPVARKPGVTTAPTTTEDFGADTNPLRILGSVGETIEGSRAGGPSANVASGSAPKSGLSSSINILVVLTVIGLAPSIMLMCTCFVRIMIVLGLVKQALGTQTLPPPQVIVGLSMFMTLLVMAPTMDRIHKEAVVPYRTGEVKDYDDLWMRAKQPLREFMFDQIAATGNWSSVYMILNYRGVDTSDQEHMTTEDVDMISLVPAFMLSELKTGFLLGFKVYLPFLVIDIVISSLLISMGMMMLPPVLISLPFKLLLFVLVDGWTLVVGSLLRSFVTHTVVPAVSEALAPVTQAFGFG